MKKDTTLTPLDFISKLGQFDLDPCGLEFHKTATKIIQLPNDGLLEDWEGRVWLNPPYSNPKPFLEKLAKHGNGIALVLNSTDTIWFQDICLKKADSMLLLKGRPKFTNKNFENVQIMRGVVLFAFGKENTEILKNCDLAGLFISLQ